MPGDDAKSDEFRKTVEKARTLPLAVERIVAERLGRLQDSFLLGNRLFGRPESNEIEASLLKGNVIPSIQARIVLERTDYELGESFQLTIQIHNTSRKPASLVGIGSLVPPDFEALACPGSNRPVGAFLDLQNKKLDSYLSENVSLTLMPTREGHFVLAPKIFYTNNIGMQSSYSPEPTSVTVSHTILPNRMKTGFQDLDNLLLGGIPDNSTIVLTSVSCDERDLLVKRFLEAGAKEENTVICAIVDPEGVRTLAEEFKVNFHVLVCNVRIDRELEKLPNVSRTAGIENLTEVNIALETMLSNLGKKKQRDGRVCLEILSDVLLEQGAVRTRKWLNMLIPELRSRGFTTLAVVNPKMHPPEQLQAILDIFDGEISIYEKSNDDYTKYMRIRKMHRQRYIETELPLRKTRLMTTPLTLSCCTRAFKV